MIGIFAWKNDKLLIQKVAGFFFLCLMAKQLVILSPHLPTHIQIFYIVWVQDSQHSRAMIMIIFFK